MEKISTIIITFNAETTIEKCLNSVQKISDDIIVVDSFSRDKTVTIAQKYTQKIFEREFLGYSKQKEYALDKTTHAWILWIDSDETLSDELIKEIQSLSFTSEGYYLPRKAFYLNKWINHCGWYPDYVLRLFKKECGSFSGSLIHEYIELTGKKQYLKNPLYHFSYRSISHHIEKMNSFTTISAKSMHFNKKRVSFFTLLSHTVAHFIKSYFLQKGFLDGTVGFIVCVHSAYYVFLKYAKCWEMQKSAKGKTEN